MWIRWQYNYIRFYEIVYRQITTDFLPAQAISSTGGTISPTITPARLFPTTIELYGPNPLPLSTGFTLNALYDARDNSINPYNGFYAISTYRNNLEFMGSNSNWESLIIDVRKYFNFPAWHPATSWPFGAMTGLSSSGKPPYLDLPSTNWDTYSSTGRGYIQGRFRGDEMVDFESEYRFPVTANGFLGAVVFVNAESFSGLNSHRLQSFQPGWGAGLRVKLNKTSRTNLDIDYGFGNKAPMASSSISTNFGDPMYR